MPMMYRSMERAAIRNNIEDLKAAIKSLRKTEDPYFFNQPQYPLNISVARCEQTVLHIAARHGSLDVINYLLDQGADIDVRDSKGNTPLHLAQGNNKDEAFQLLLDRGADPSIANKIGFMPEAAGFSVSSYEAISRNNAPLLKKLLTPSHQPFKCRNAQDNHGNTLLHHAVDKGNHSCVEILLDRSVDTSLKNKNGMVPGKLAAEKRQFWIADQLHSTCFSIGFHPMEPLLLRRPIPAKTESINQHTSRLDESMTPRKG